MHAREMISSHPNVEGGISEPLIACIEACYACAQSCTACADACVAEQQVAELRQCIRLDLDCADICTATGSLASRRAGSDQEVLRTAIELCALACRICAEECEKHAHAHEHCRICALECRNCEQACVTAIRSVH
ncbi:MAG: four-helix bundle copper-binding protein [Bradyrhizobium sp.]|uniref:four-helix bundle copper-binding protein n=1 Tax=Bradyrhizobium sp. TaxID=376 RepID=UPI0025C6AA9B|nr:four-helix bundle copper-binding protein [Bradyrhizobium sp.]MBI5264565.1 four-helix bundle copper-binding protein [Bradyrhizobium sp.]